MHASPCQGRAPPHNPAQPCTTFREGGHRLPPYQPCPSEAGSRAVDSRPALMLCFVFFFLTKIQTNRRGTDTRRQPPVSLRSWADLVPRLCPPVSRHKSRSLAAVTQGFMLTAITVVSCDKCLNLHWNLRTLSFPASGCCTPQDESCQRSLCHFLMVWPGRRARRCQMYCWAQQDGARDRGSGVRTSANDFLGLCPLINKRDSDFCWGVDGDWLWQEKAS